MSLALLFFLPLFGGLISLLPLEPSQRRLLGFVIFTGLLASFLQISLGELPKTELLGSWPHYAGITWVADWIGLSFIFAAVILYFPCMWSIAKFDRNLNVLFHFLAAAVIGCFLTGDLFNLYVMFETLLLSTYAVFYVCKFIRSGRLFIWVNIFLSALFLFGVAFIYKTTGTVNYVELGVQFQNMDPKIRDLIFSGFALVFLGKAALIPLGIWLPSSYPALPASLLAFIGSLSTKVGLFALLRWTHITGVDLMADHSWWLWPFALLTVLIGAVGAVMSERLRGALAYYGLSHIGLLFLALMLYSTSSLSALLLYFIHDAIVMAGLFFFCEDHEAAGRPRTIFKRQALIGVCFLVLALASAGFPPSGGFIGKFLMLEAAQAHPGLVLSIVASAFLFVVFAISRWNRDFVGRAASPKSRTRRIKLQLSTIYCTGLVILVSGFAWIEPNFFDSRVQKSQAQYEESVRDATREILKYREQSK